MKLLSVLAEENAYHKFLTPADPGKVDDDTNSITPPHNGQKNIDATKKLLNPRDTGTSTPSLLVASDPATLN